MPRTSATARSFGQAAPQAFLAIRQGSALPGDAGPSSSRSSPCSAWSVAMPPHLPAQPLGDGSGQPRGLSRVDPPRPVSGHRVLLDDPSGSAAEHYDPVTEPHRLPYVMSNEQD